MTKFQKVVLALFSIGVCFVLFWFSIVMYRYSLSGPTGNTPQPVANINSIVFPTSVPIPVEIASPTPAFIQITPPVLTASPTQLVTPVSLRPSSTPPIMNTPMSLPTPTLALVDQVPDAWMNWPVIPTAVSKRTLEIYQNGLKKGNHANVFSIVGDSNSTFPYFLNYFDNPKLYNLAGHVYLAPAITYFKGSFSRPSIPTRVGQTAFGVLSNAGNEFPQCNKGESLLNCEYRINRPGFALISLGTNDAYDVNLFKRTYRSVVDQTITQGIVPILATKVDNLEGDHQINLFIATLAHNYGVPLWNYWSAVQGLPYGGLRDCCHPTAGNEGLYDFHPEYLSQHSWPVRNLTALQTLDAVWRSCAVP